MVYALIIFNPFGLFRELDLHCKNKSDVLIIYSIVVPTPTRKQNIITEDIFTIA